MRTDATQLKVPEAAAAIQRFILDVSLSVRRSAGTSIAPCVRRCVLGYSTARRVREKQVWLSADERAGWLAGWLAGGSIPISIIALSFGFCMQTTLLNVSSSSASQPASLHVGSYAQALACLLPLRLGFDRYLTFRRKQSAAFTALRPSSQHRYQQPRQQHAWMLWDLCFIAEIVFTGKH